MANVYEMVRERIISSLSSGMIPWHQSWKNLSPCNLLTGRPYRGINRLLLSGHEWWGTYRQIKQLGGYVRKGEKASGLVVFWSFEEARPIVNDPGDEVLVMSQREKRLSGITGSSTSRNAKGSRRKRSARSGRSRPAMK